jgi:hypothetical protein
VGDWDSETKRHERCLFFFRFYFLVSGCTLALKSVTNQASVPEEPNGSLSIDLLFTGNWGG